MIPLRCAECLTHEHLYGATDECSAHGSIGPDGDFETLDCEAPFGPDFASVECSEHPGAGLHFYVREAWNERVDCWDAWHDLRNAWPRPRDLSHRCPSCDSTIAERRGAAYRPPAAAALAPGDEHKATP